MGLQNLSDKNVRSTFFAAYDQAEAGSWANLIAFRNPSDQETETYRWLGQTATLREWVGGRLMKKPRDEVYTIRNLPYEATLEIDADDLRRDNTGQIAVRIQDLAARAASHWEKLLSDLINVGESALGFDGVAFFSASHVSGASGTQINALTSTQVPELNIATAGAPTSAEMANAINGVIAYMMTYKDDTGEPINQNAKQFAVMVPVNMWAALRVATGADFLTAGVTNPLKPRTPMDYTIMPILNPRLTLTSTKFCVFRVDAPLKPLIMQDEFGPDLIMLSQESDYTFLNNKRVWGLKANRACGYGLWYHAAVCTTV